MSSRQTLNRCLETWLTVVQRAKDAISSGDMDELSELMELRGEILSLIQRLDPASDTAQESLVGHTLELWRKIEPLEQEVVLLAKQRMTELSSELGNVRKTREVAGSLRSLDGGARQGRHLDNYR